MAEIVNIRVSVSGAQKANADLLKLKNTADDLRKPITLTVDAAKLSKTTQALLKYNTQLERRKANEAAVEAAVWKAEEAETRRSIAQIQRIEKETNAQARLTKAQNEAAVQQEKTRQAEERTAQAKERTRQAEERTAQTKEKTRQVEERTAQVKERAAQAAERQAAANNRLGGSLTGLVAQFVSLHMLLSRTVSAFRDALQTMKDVDSALVTIQKTTGYTGEQLDRLTNSAYELANAYGRTATEILNAASVYARAGFKDNLDQMTELSALLQNVGDLEGDVAAKFLIATNAAWKLNGSYDALMSVIDGLNAQTNQAAVDMEALTSGITVAGSVFSNAGESVQTFSGLLGAGVALTQRSGSEVARGLRTIAMNIRQIKGELDDGEIIDEASISDAAKALHSVGISIADANGELRLTSAVLDELAGRWGKLTTAEQSYLAQSLAGKRQANILNALMNNWEEAQRQMMLYANGAGSALQENEIYLNSWEAKTKQLSAAWTKFVNDLVDTDLIKKALDGIIKTVEFLDTDFGRLLVTSLGIGTAVISLAGAVGALKTAVIALTGAMSANPLFLAAAGATAAISGIVLLADKLTTTTEEYAEKAEDAWAAYQEINSEVDQLKNRAGELTEYERQRLNILKAEAQLRHDEAVEASKEHFAAKYRDYSNVGSGSRYDSEYMQLQRELETAARGSEGSILKRMSEIEAVSGAQNRASQLVGRYAEITRALESSDLGYAQLKKLEDEATDLRKEIVELADDLNSFGEELGKDFPKDAQLTLDFLMRIIGVITNAKDETKDAASSTADAIDDVRKRLQSFSDAADSIDVVIGAVVDALHDYGEGSVQVYDAMKNLESVIPGSTDKLYDFETATLLSSDALDADKASLLDLIDAEKQVDFQNAINQMNAVSQAAWEMWAAEAMAMQGLSNDDLLRAGEWMGVNPNIASQIAEVKKAKADWDEWIATLRSRSSYAPSGSGGGSSSTSSTDLELERRKAIVALRKQELEFLKASGASEEEIVAKQKEIQAALHDEAEYLRQTKEYTEGDESAVAEVVALSTEWWKIQSEITKDGEDELQNLKDKVSLLKSELSFLESSGASTDDIIAKQKEIQNALHEQAEYMRSIGASQTEINALSTEWWDIQNKILKTQQELFDTIKKTVDEYYDKAVTDKEKELALEEKILAVQQAQIALQNAQKERTVRYFNAASGQWEWGANQKNVKSAQDALTKAQDALNDYQKEQAWKEFKDAWAYVADQIKAGAMTFAQAYDYMEREMKRLQDKYNVDMSGVLKDSIGGFRGVNKTIKDLDAKTADELSKVVGLISKQNELMYAATFDAKAAVKSLKDAFDLVVAKVKSGEMSFEDAYKFLRDQAEEIAETYGVDMTKALDDAIAQMATIYSGLDGLKTAVEEGALTPDEAFDIISTALNAVSSQYGERITEEVNRILEEENGFVGGLEGLADAVRNGQISVEDAFDYIEDATQKVSDKYGIDMTDALNTAIQKMGMSSDALDDLWKSIVMNQMRMNSVSWLELDEQEKKARASGDTATADAIKAQKEQLHAANEALGETIGATYDPSGYWSLNGNTLYDPNADRESGAFSGGGGGGGGFASTGITGVNPSGLSYGIGGIDGDLPTDVIGKGVNNRTRYYVPGYGFINTSLAVANLLTPTAGRKGDQFMTAQLINLGTDAEIEEYFRTHEVPASFAANYDTIWKYNNGVALSEGELNAADANIAMTERWGITRNRDDIIRQTGVEPEVFGKVDEQIPLNVIWYATQAVAGNDADTYDSGGVLHGIGGIKATAQDEMVLPPDITNALLSPVSNGLVSSRLNDIRMWLGMKPEAGTTRNSIGTQNNGDNYIMNGVSIGEQAARSTTVYDLAHIARNLGAYQRS